MPPSYVKTIREEILYGYAKLISKSTYGLSEDAMLPRFHKGLTLISDTDTNTYTNIANDEEK
jgi:hypothetical protein